MTELPEEIAAYLKDARIGRRAVGVVKVVVVTDYDTNGNLAPHWAVAGTRALVLIDPEARTHTLYENSRLADLKVETMVAGGLLSARIDGQPTLLLRFSNTRARDMGHFVRIASKLIGGERVRQEDLTQEEYSPTCPT